MKTKHRKISEISSSVQISDSDKRVDMKEGWKIKRLGDVCEVIAGQSPESRYYISKGIGLPFYQGKKEFTYKYIGEPTTWSSKITKEAFEGDILISVRAPVGPINFSTQHICIGRGLAAIRAGESIDKEFLFDFVGITGRNGICVPLDRLENIWDG